MSLPLPPILVVDDEKNMRLSLKSILHGEGYDVQMVESAEEAIAALEKLEFLMVITDARLGKMSGYEFLAQACKRWPNVPFLMITAYATPKLAVEAIKAGAIDYLAKPFAPEELLHAVSRCAERHRLLRENAVLARPRHRGLPARTDHRRIPQNASNCASSSKPSPPPTPPSSSWAKAAPARNSSPAPSTA